MYLCWYLMTFNSRILIVHLFSICREQSLDLSFNIIIHVEKRSAVYKNMQLVFTCLIYVIRSMAKLCILLIKYFIKKIFVL